MSDEHYTVKIDRRNGTVEITGSDKDWIAEQLDKLTPILAVGAGHDDPMEEGRAGEGPTPADGSGTGRDKSSTESDKPRARRSSTPRRVVANADLTERLDKPMREKLHKYQQERLPGWKGDPNKVAIIATFLADELDIHEIGVPDLLAVFSAMGWAPPKSPSGTLTNAIRRNGYFSGMRDKKTQLTPTGEHFGRHASQQAPEKK